MKNTLLLLAFLLPLCAGAQIAERSLSAGFLTEGNLIRPYGANQWLLAGWSTPELGAYFKDTLYWAILDQNGAIVRRQRINAPVEELHFWHDILALPDGGVFAVFESSLCDVASYKRSLQRFDNQGNLLWDTTQIVSFDDLVPIKWFLANDGNLLGLGNHSVWKISSLSGDLISKFELEGIDNGLIYISQAQLINGTENLVAIGTPSLQIWTKTGQKYVLSDSMSVFGFRNTITEGPDGAFYTVQTYPEKWLEKFDLQLNYTKLAVASNLGNGYVSFVAGNNGLYLAEHYPPDLGTFQRFDFSGNNPLNLFSFGEHWRNPISICARNGKIAVCGTEYSGQYSNFQPINSTGAWVRIFDESQTNILPLLPDIKVSNVKQTMPVDTNYVGQVAYSLDGGGFQVEVTNTGLTPVDQVAVNVGFARNEYFDICVNFPAKQVVFKNLQLNPGESTLLGFGNVHADGQAQLPGEFCFWVSSPDEKPDADHSNDRFCKPVSFTVGVKDLDASMPALQPNPADEYVELPATEETSQWEILDLCGKRLDSGIFTSGARGRISTAHFPSGMYVFRQGKSSGKLLIQH